MATAIASNKQLPPKEQVRQALLIVASSLHTEEFPHHRNYTVYAETATIQTTLRSIRDTALRLDEKHSSKGQVVTALNGALQELGIESEGTEDFLNYEEIRAIALLSTPNEATYLRNRIMSYALTAQNPNLKDRKMSKNKKLLIGSAIQARNPTVIQDIVLYNELQSTEERIKYQKHLALILLIAKDLKNSPYRVELEPSTLDEISAILRELNDTDELESIDINSSVIEYHRYLYR